MKTKKMNNNSAFDLITGTWKGYDESYGTLGKSRREDVENDLSEES